MDNWSDKEKQDFTHHYQKIHLKGNDPNNSIKCQYKRQSIHLMLNTAQKKCSNEATCHILKMKLREYSALVDNQDGVNNYASGVLDLMAQNANDSQKWKSSADASELLKKFLKPLPGNCENKCDEGCKAQKPTLMELKGFLNNKTPFKSSLSPLNKPQSATVKKTNKSFDSNIQATPVAATSSRKQQAGRMSSMTGNDSKLMNAIGSRVFGTEKSKVINQPVNQTKKPQVPSFRTAGTELKLQNAKKYGKKAGTSNVGEEKVAYGCGKKSLGGRTRSVNSKFVPPVKPDSQYEEENSEQQEEEDERLRLIDPKIVELVRSEIMDHGPPVHWDDIAGLQFAKATIQEIVVLPMLRPDIFTGLRRPPKGILLFGPPGTGKTLIGKCIASQSKSTFFNISASSLTSKWVGEGEKMVRTLFALARVHQPAVVFIDEIDSLLSQRSESEHESSRRIKTEFLVQLDGAGTGEEDRILVIGATNRPQELDEAARRRLVKRLYIPLPDKQARCQIVRNLMSGERNELTPAQVEEIANLTDGYSGADMKVVCQEACLGPVRAISFADMQHIQADQVRPVTIGDFKAALACVRSSVSPNDLEVYVHWDKTYGSGGAPK